MAKDKENRAAKDQHVGDVERIRVIDRAAAHIDVIGNRTIDNPIIGIAERTADYSAGSQS
jgi:hypothetical protein